jgi:undecaprenyl-diphosphatase
VAFALAIVWRRPAVPLYVIAAVASADMLATLGKALVHRHRPFEHQIGPSERTHSWPSGHAATAFAGAATLAWLVPRFRLLWYALAVLIAYSRLYNGVHYPTDVLSGAILGLLVAWVVRRLRFTR